MNLKFDSVCSSCPSLEVSTHGKLALKRIVFLLQGTLQALLSKCLALPIRGLSHHIPPHLTHTLLLFTRSGAPTPNRTPMHRSESMCQSITDFGTNCGFKMFYPDLLYFVFFFCDSGVNTVTTTRRLLHTAPVCCPTSCYPSHNSGPAKWDACSHVCPAHPSSPSQWCCHGDGSWHHHGHVCW